MSKKLALVLVSGIFVFGISKLSFAQVHSEHEPGMTETSKTDASEKAANTGNKICPVSGEKIDEKLKATYEYEGKIYNFCCTSCIEEFKKDPQKYIKKVEEELQPALKEQTEHKGHEMGMM